MPAGSCAYVLDPERPETWNGEDGDQCHVSEQKLSPDRVWRCPHDSRPGEELCQFHLPVEHTDDIQVTQAFLDAVENTENGDLELLGARFGTVKLPKQSTIERTGTGIDLSHASIAGPLDWSEATLDTEFLYLLGATFDDEVTFRDATIDAHAGFLGASFTAPAQFDGASFRDADFRSWPLVPTVGRISVRMYSNQYQLHLLNR